MIVADSYMGGLHSNWSIELKIRLFGIQRMFTKEIHNKLFWILNLHILVIIASDLILRTNMQ